MTPVDYLGMFIFVVGFGLLLQIVRLWIDFYK